MPSISAGYKAEYIALINEIETKMKVVINDAVLYDRGVLETNYILLKLIKEFRDTLPKEVMDKDEMVKAMLFTKDKWLNEYSVAMDIGYNQARTELERTLGVVITTKGDFFNTLMGNLNKLDIEHVPDIVQGSTLVFNRGLPPIERYWDHVRQAQANFIEEVAIFPSANKTTALSVRSSLEIAIRHEFHMNQLEEMRARGVRLVRITSHADCSKRCEPYQHKVYSLDGTSGVEYGERYEPIENATDVFMTTRKGKTWKNGLFGFHCKHGMIEFVPGAPQTMEYTKQEIANEREISTKQRKMERDIFKTKQEAVFYNQVDPARAKYLRKKSRDMVEHYRRYSEANNRAVYVERYTVSRQLRNVIAQEKGKAS